MDIKNLNSSVISGRNNDSSVKHSDAGGKASQASAAVETNSDKVTLTESLSQIAQLEQKAKSAPTDNAERIAELKAAINDGSYQVNSQKVAEKLLQTEQLFARK